MPEEVPSRKRQRRSDSADLGVPTLTKTQSTPARTPEAQSNHDQAYGSDDEIRVVPDGQVAPSVQSQPDKPLGRASSKISQTAARSSPSAGRRGNNKNINNPDGNRSSPLSTRATQQHSVSEEIAQNGAVVTNFPPDHGSRKGFTAVNPIHGDALTTLPPIRTLREPSDAPAKSSPVAGGQTALQALEAAALHSQQLVPLAVQEVDNNWDKQKFVKGELDNLKAQEVTKQEEYEGLKRQRESKESELEVVTFTAREADSKLKDILESVKAMAISRKS